LKENDMLSSMLHREMPPAGGHFDPFRQMQSAQADLNRLFSGLASYPATEYPLLNLWTNADGAVIAAEVPGVAPEDLDITIRRDIVTLRGNRPPEMDDDGTLVQRQERMHGPFSRTITLPFRVDADKATASFEHGVVTLTLPRPEDDKPRRIKVARS
jgi:HSP20 family protein